VSVRDDVRAAALDAAARLLGPSATRPALLATADTIEGVALAAQLWERVNRVELTLRRGPSANDCTISELLINGEHECFVCEDVVRELDGIPVEEWKIASQTAIPSGRFRIVITWSQRFQRMLPLLMAVPGFTGIRIHPGNKAVDTDGCLLPGVQRSSTGVQQSKIAFEALFEKINTALQGGSEVWITIYNSTLTGVVS